MRLDHMLMNLSPHAHTPLRQLFDHMPDMLVFIKDEQGRYRWGNQLVVARSGQRSLQHVVGQTAQMLFSGTCVNADQEDSQVIARARPVQHCLNSYRPRGARELVWCLCSKFPVFDEQGQAVGLVGMSRDLPISAERQSSYQRLERFLQYIDARLEEGVLIADAARHAGLSTDALNRLVMEVFQTTPKQLLTRKRIARACMLLEESSDSITSIAGACGYADHSAFARQFKTLMHMPPRQYRDAWSERQRQVSTTATTTAARPATRAQSLLFPGWVN